MILFYVFYLCGLLLSVTQSQNIGGSCITPSGEVAKCISIHQCDSIVALLGLPTRTQEQTNFIKFSKCGSSSTGEILVCCGSGFNKVAASVNVTEEKFEPNPSLPSKNECGWQSADQISNDEATELDVFPWMAYIQYLTPKGNRRIRCAGSLINKRYILTTAHCVHGDHLENIGKPINIRLGEYKIISPRQDCVLQHNYTFCNHVKVGIKKLIPHPNYTGNLTNLSDDIALIRLKKSVQYSDYIQPICLPEPNSEAAIGEKLTVAKWGETEKDRNSGTLKLSVFKTDFDQCVRAYTTMGVTLNENQLCAVDKVGTDHCSGTSGSPLMRNLPTDRSRFILEGVVSVGLVNCKREEYPGVYTKVANYISWIHNTVKP